MVAPGVVLRGRINRLVPGKPFDTDQDTLRALLFLHHEFIGGAWFLPVYEENAISELGAG